MTIEPPADEHNRRATASGGREAPVAAPPLSAAGTLACGLATAGLLWLCHYPLAWGFLAWVALVPLLCLVRSTAPAGRLYLSALVCGLAFYGPAMRWMPVADYRMWYTWAGLATYCAFYMPLAIYLVRRLDRGTSLPLLATVPAVWTALEYLRAELGTGFAWYFLSHTQQALLPVIQIADLGGAYAVTLVVAAANAWLFELLATRLWFRRLLSLSEKPARRRALLLQSAAVLLLLGLVLVYGFWRLNQTQFQEGPRVALIQGNLDQRLRNAAADADKAATSMVRHYDALSGQAAAQQPKPELIVWPETSFPYEWNELSPDFLQQCLPSAGGPRPNPPPTLGEGTEVPSALVGEGTSVPSPLVGEGKGGGATQPSQSIDPHRWYALWRFSKNKPAFESVSRCRTNVLLGLNTEVWTAKEKTQRYNSAVLINGNNGEVAERYDKIHRVPFGEYVPLRDWLPWMNVFAPYDFDYSIQPGQRLTRFPLGHYHFGVIICFEDTDPDLPRRYVSSAGDEPNADFLINISNDGWFDGSSEHEEHLAICRFRAVECRRAVARAVNMGISGVIDGNGRLIALPGATWAASKKIEAVVSAPVPIDDRASLYARWGDWLPALCGMGLLFGTVWTVMWPMKRPR